MKGLIFNVKRYSIHDGPGIRVTFFMKGCPLGCIWCHNPEGISPFAEKVARINKVGNKEFSSNEVVGRQFSVNNILEILEKESIFLNQSKGGVTFSGGEPMMQFDFLLAVLKACKEKRYHTAVDTSGYATTEQFESVIPYTDLFLFDLKHVIDAKHIVLTGVTNYKILENYKRILDSGKDIMARVPIIPGMNDEHGSLEQLRQFINETKTKSLKRISLLPYHKIGSSKYKRFNIPYRMHGLEPPTRARMLELKDFFSEVGVKVMIGG